MEAKREIVYEVSEWTEGAKELLQSWSRQDIVQVLCAETGKERKYTGLTKSKIIDILLKVVADKKRSMISLESSESGHGRGAKRQRKSDCPNVSMDSSLINIVECDPAYSETKVCKNSACRARLSQEDAFCKRCSCCICHQFDDNKDPSLWLICSSEPPYEGKSCGMSCHLECALQHERSGIPKDGLSRGLDGSFYCVSCGKVNDLLQCWRKQMVTARDTRRVDILCYRVSLSHKLLTGTQHYQSLDRTVVEAIQKLEADVGPLTGLPVKRARGIINRLSSGQEVQRLCASAVDSLDSILSNTLDPAAKDPSVLTPVVKYESVCPRSIFVSLDIEDGENPRGYNYSIWHRKAEDTDYPAEATCTLVARSSTKFLLSSLTPATQYVLRMILFERSSSSSSRELCCREYRFQTSSNMERSQTNSSPNPSSVEDESKDEIEREFGRSKLDDFGYYVKVIRWLECKRHIDKSFREKFLSWYGLRASPKEVRIVKVLIDNLMEDPACLAGQLVDTFSQVITSSKNCSKGLCLKLFH